MPTIKHMHWKNKQSMYEKEACMTDLHMDVYTPHVTISVIYCVLTTCKKLYMTCEFAIETLQVMHFVVKEMRSL